MTIKEIKTEIKATKAEMKKYGIRRVSCFNGGLSPTEHFYNSKLFRLKTELNSKIKQVKSLVEDSGYSTKEATELLDAGF